MAAACLIFVATIGIAFVQGDPSSPQGSILYIVDSTGDGALVGSPSFCDDGTGHCTLRAAIQAANGHPGDDGIQFNIPTSDPGYFGGVWTIFINPALPDLSSNIDILAAPNTIKVRRSVVTAFRIFTVTSPGTVSLSGMGIEHGNSSLGGGVCNAGSGVLNIIDCKIESSVASSGAGVANTGGGTINITGGFITLNTASAVGGGIYNAGTGVMNINNCGIIQNTATSPVIGTDTFGGGIFNTSGTVSMNGGEIFDNTSVAGPANSSTSAGAAYGAGIYSGGGTVTITDALVYANHANGGDIAPSGTSAAAGASYGGGIYSGGGNMNIVRSTVYGNYAASTGAFGGSSYGAGIYISGGGGSLINSTIANNYFPSSSGTQDGAGIFNLGTMTISNSTIVRNMSSGTGGGIVNGGGATLKSTILANNTASTGPDAYIALGSQGYNLFKNTSGVTIASQPTDIIGVDPMLTPFDNGGGPTVMVPKAGSPVIDKGTSHGLTGNLTTDQRGNSFPRTLDYTAIANATGADADGTDIGSIEFALLNVTSITRSGNDIVVTFGQTFTGTIYRLERKLAITDTSWQSIAGVDDVTAGSNTTAQITDPNAIPLGKAFYRVRSVP